MKSELEVLEILSKAKFPCQKPLGIFSFKGRPAALFSYIEGKSPEKVDEGLAFQMGTLLGEFHRMLSGRKLSVKKSGWDEKSFWKLYMKHEKKIRGSKIKKASFFMDFASKEMTKIERRVNARQGIIHPDIKLENIIVKGGKISIVDFDDITEAPYVENLAMTAIWLCFPKRKLNQKLYRALLDGYLSRFKLTREELHLIPYYTKVFLLFGMLNWCHKVMHRPKQAYEGAKNFYDIYNGL